MGSPMKSLETNEAGLTVDEWWTIREQARALPGNRRVAAYNLLWQLFQLLSDEDMVEAQKRWAYGHTTERVARSSELRAG